VLPAAAAIGLIASPETLVAASHPENSAANDNEMRPPLCALAMNRIRKQITCGTTGTWQRTLRWCAIDRAKPKKRGDKRLLALELLLSAASKNAEPRLPLLVGAAAMTALAGSA
jgi:hypothetical protein